MILLALRLPDDLDGTESAVMQKMLVQSLGQEGPLEKEMAVHSDILAWEIQWTEESGRQCLTWPSDLAHVQAGIKNMQCSI